MNRGAHRAPGLADQLALADPVTDRDQGLGRGANMLTQGDNQPPGQGRARQGDMIRQGLLVRQVQATGEGPELALAGAESVGVWD